MNLLLGVDLREDARPLVTDVADWARRLDARVDLAYVDAFRKRLNHTPDPRTEALLDREIHRMIAEDEKAIADLGALIPQERRGRCALHTGDPADTLAEEAAHHDLVAVGTHGRTGVARVWLGSVAERVVRRSSVPVLVVRRVARPGPVRMLVAIDLRDPMGLVERAAKLANQLVATVDLMYVEPGPSVSSTFGDPHVQMFVANSWDQLAAVHREALVQALTVVRPERRGEVRISFGPPAASIVEVADGYDLVVCGSHGRQGLERMWLGSVAERVLRLSPASVLLLPIEPSAVSS